MTTKTSTKTGQATRRPRTPSKPTRELLAPKVKSNVGRAAILAAVKAVQKAAETTDPPGDPQCLETSP